MDKVLYDKNANAIELQGLWSLVANAYLNTAAVSVTLKKDGVALGGVTWPLSLVYVTGTNGNYRVVLPPAVVYPVGKTVIAEITAAGVDPTTEYAFYQTPCHVAKRRHQ